MADNMSVSNPSIPLFKGENYEFWSIKMMTLFKSQVLWNLVNNGVPDPDPDPNQQENENEDARALFYIQLAVHDTIFSKIAAATNAKEAWIILKIAFQGSTRVMAIKLQGLHRDFETLQMNKEETIQVFPFKSTNGGQSNQSIWRHHGGEDCGGKGVEKPNTQVRSCGSSNRRVQKSRHLFL
jgi:gag-polypeptide of LTR copia-type